jgi:hypothetical protein
MTKKEKAAMLAMLPYAQSRAEDLNDLAYHCAGAPEECPCSKPSSPFTCAAAADKAASAVMVARELLEA